MTPTREQLARIAELRIWNILIRADDEVRGLEPDRVLGHARARAAWLESRLLGISPHEQDDAITNAKQRDRDRAYGEAALSMRGTLSMVSADQEMSRE